MAPSKNANSAGTNGREGRVWVKSRIDPGCALPQPLDCSLAEGLRELTGAVGGVRDAEEGGICVGLEKVAWKKLS